jgi:hypothetical protein
MIKIFNLKYFLLSQQSLELYRQFMKILSRIPDDVTKKELHSQIRS